MKKVALKIQNISKSFPGTKALDNVSMDVHEGEVHALVGENGAGKSTLMNIISGVLKADSGSILLDGKEMHFDHPKQAQDAGIAFVHQELAMCPELTVAENLFIGRDFLQGKGLVNFKEMNKCAEEILKPFKHGISPTDRVSSVNIAEQQIIEMVRATSQACKILILDEPTSSLTDTETIVMFKIINNLKAKGISIIYISHKMDEIFQICDRVTVLRDGKYIDTKLVQEVNERDILYMMIGREISDLYPPKGNNITDEVIFEVKNLSKKRKYKNINIKLKRGEVLGIVGLIGAGRTEMACGICGIEKPDSGEMTLEGKPMKVSNFKDAIVQGLTYMTEDRKKQGLYLDFDISKNLTCSNLDKVPNKKIINRREENRIAHDFAERMRIKCSSVEQKVGSLSGGNQQKVMLSKWVFTDPKVLILDEPTRGIDVGEKAQIHKMMRAYANSGIGVIIISSEMPEIIGMSDRVLVMHKGEIIGELSGDEITEKNMIFLATGKQYN